MQGIRVRLGGGGRGRGAAGVGQCIAFSSGSSLGSCQVLCEPDVHVQLQPGGWGVGGRGRVVTQR